MSLLEIYNLTAWPWLPTIGSHSLP
jgi:hypothetical protein